MAYSTVVTPNVLREGLDAPDWILFDCQFDLAHPETGRDRWRQGHIPGARHADLERHLTGSVGPSTGRHPLPEPGRLRRWLRACGVRPGIQVVCYDADSGAFAARLWWLLRWLGHPEVAVLDGGLAAWGSLGCEVASGENDAPSSPQCSDEMDELDSDPVSDGVVGAEGLRNNGSWLVVDARAPERFRGDREPIDPLPGHVPGALNRPFTDNLRGGGRFRSPASLHAEWSTLLGHHGPESVVHMCGSGVTAAHNQLAMAYAGLDGSRLYPGSWSEWITDRSRPIATGP